MHRPARLCLLVLFVWLAPALASAQDRIVYDDALASDFQDWSWATRDLDNAAPVAAGTRSIAFEADGFTGLYFFATNGLELADWRAIQLQIHGGPSGGQGIRLLLQQGGSAVGDIALDPAPAGAWQTVTLDLRAIGLVAGPFDGIIFQDTSGGDQPTLYLDEIVLLEDDAPPPPPTSARVDVDPNADRRPIDPRIYGVAFGDANRLGEVGYTVRRWGGNSVTRYNWQAAVHNTAFDYFFQNIVDDVIDPALLPDGSSSDIFIDEALSAGAEVLMTAPAIGWTPVPVREKKWAYSVAQYGPQLQTECSFYGPNPPFWCTADSGDGRCDPAVNTTGFCGPDGTIVGNDPADTSMPIGPSFVGDWVRHVVGRVGTAAEGGVRYWAIDNEPMLWHNTHRDVVPEPLTYDALWSRTTAYADAIRTADPTAEILGPVVWGWCAYFSSAADAVFPNGSCTDGPDRQAHNDLPLLAWYLEQVCEAEVQTGTRPIDYLDVHIYPQGDVAGLGGASSSEDPTTAARRLRSVRELWDPTHVSESWINEATYLIPRMRGWIDAHCPGVGLAVTEYRWGEDDGPSSALAHAEVLALFGREGVDLATRWVAPATDSRVEDAFELFLNYDGAGARVDGDSVRAISDRPDDLGSYAIAGADGALWLVLINRATVPLEAAVAVAGVMTPGDAPLYRFDGSSGLAPAGTVAVVDGAVDFTVTLPARSVTLVAARGAQDAIFANGFESGDTAAWSAAP
ncbi:MAG: glycoside hydrolase family 44 protein [Acidobacteriota bacterium]